MKTIIYYGKNKTIITQWFYLRKKAVESTLEFK